MTSEHAELVERLRVEPWQSGVTLEAASAIESLSARVGKLERLCRKLQDTADAQGIRAGIAETSLKQVDADNNELRARLGAIYAQPTRISVLSHEMHGRVLKGATDALFELPLGTELIERPRRPG